MTIAFISHPNCLKHEMGATHPESPARLLAIDDQLIASGIDVMLKHYSAPLASVEQLCRVHDQNYVETILRTIPAEDELVWLDPDTAMNHHTAQAALHAAGAVIKAVDLVMTDEVKHAFCSVRPPGHHANSNRAMGFCFFNNIAVGAAHALQHWNLQRVAIVDFDVHHGNGTEQIFKQDPRVFLCSTFQHPFYPYSDTVGNNHIIKIPLPAGTGGDIFRVALQTQGFEPLKQFNPQLIMISAGFDAHREEVMASLRLTESDYSWITKQIMSIAHEQANDRVVSVLEGGYALSALGRSVAAHINAMLD